MNAAIPDLWPADFGTAGQPSPAAILRQQAYALGQRTRNVVVGEVESDGRPGDGFSHSFVVSAPVLNFREPLVQVRHGVKHYPAEFFAMKVGGGGIESRAAVESAPALLALLGAAFNRGEVVELIRSLLDQSQAEYE